MSRPESATHKEINMAEYTAEELFEILNDTDECPWIEAKGIGYTTTSIMETVCSYANEPGLGGGYILMNISADDSPLPLLITRLTQYLTSTNCKVILPLNVPVCLIYRFVQR